ncbi:translational activator of cytochrome c oxidase 1 [Lagopus muta]|uniref:translational activator of cytochrome c oxidase 1 n=1 Tax=Lagopus muta TaxID=64668 RepID=UPI0020A075F1|nr:translational activator of cytochrome c oxidase 1 [Lagopus muta]
MAPPAAMTVARWCRLVHMGAPSSAGHNRWSKVRHHKGQRDGERAQLIQRLSARVRAAAAAGGPDPALNAALAQAVAQCRANNVPKASIMAAIASADKALGSQRLQAVRGPGGSTIIIISDGTKGDDGSLKGLLGREGASPLSLPGAALQQRALIRAAASRPIDLEAALQVAIAAGAEDVRMGAKGNGGDGGQELQFLCRPSDLSSVGQRLQQEGLRLLSSGVRWFPRRQVALRAEQRERAERLIRELRRCAGVIEVIHNIREPEGGEEGGAEAEGGGREV